MRIKLSASLRLKKEKGFCIVKDCYNAHGTGRNYCYKHMMQRYKRNNPIQYAYNAHVQNARQEGKKILTPRQFARVWKLKNQVRLKTENDGG